MSLMQCIVRRAATEDFPQELFSRLLSISLPADIYRDDISRLAVAFELRCAALEAFFSSFILQPDETDMPPRASF